MSFTEKIWKLTQSDVKNCSTRRRRRKKLKAAEIINKNKIVEGVFSRS